MELVVDTNILFTYFWKNSIVHRIMLKQESKLYSPEFSLEEINKYAIDIMEKAKISLGEFKKTRKELAIAVEFIPVESYKEFLKDALSFSPDPNDIDFFALALKLKLPIWSNDTTLKNQEAVPIFSTYDILDKFFGVTSHAKEE